jgi:Tfp pilus assembly protein PilN
MMYSQQEYDMVRRQTMQIEAEKRALLRWVLLGVTALLAASLIFTGWMFRRYITADNLIRTANERTAVAETQLQQVSRELAEKKAILERNSATLAKQNDVITSTVPKMLNKSANPTELAELALAIYQQPGHVIELPSIPPDSVLRSYRARVDGRSQKYTLVAGQIDGQWVLYSLLVKNEGD